MWGLAFAISACVAIAGAIPAAALHESVVFERIIAAMETLPPCETDPDQPF